ncbi:MAG: diacylglycerol kinase family lipid kinase [Erysipelotrichaceae bacterium]|nr:diacylglycerol kinase family lipid kinase [Erysipelotrichaceae bacterium]
MKHIFIVNPTSGREAAKRIVPMIEEYFNQNPQEYEIRMTEYPGHAKEIAQQYQKEDDVCLYAVGGDGTLWEVVNGIQPQVPMALIPSGTGNDFFRMIDADLLDMPKLLKDTIEGEELSIDYGVCNGMRFINCLCMGVDADVNARVCEIGKQSIVPKKMLYGVSAMHVVRKLNVLNFKFSHDSADFVQKDGLLVAVMNGRHYGGGFTPTPFASFKDGFFDICLIRPVKLARLITLLPKYFKGTHTDIDVVENYQAKQVKLEFEYPINVSLDGEMFKMSELDAYIVENGLTLKVPRGSYHEIRK